MTVERECPVDLANGGIRKLTVAQDHGKISLACPIHGRQTPWCDTVELAMEAPFFKSAEERRAEKRGRK